MFTHRTNQIFGRYRRAIAKRCKTARLFLQNRFDAFCLAACTNCVWWGAVVLRWLVKIDIASRGKLMEKVTGKLLSLFCDFFIFLLKPIIAFLERRIHVLQSEDVHSQIRDD